jgi:heptosyltransferase-3
VSQPRSAEGAVFPPLPPPAHLLVYRPGAIGDFILALPALAALRRAFPAATLTVVGHPAAVELASSAGLADATLAADATALTPLFAEASPVAALIPPPALAVLWAGASARPLAANLRALGAEQVLHVPSQPPLDQRQHVADYLVESLAPLGVDGDGTRVPCCRPGPEAPAEAAAFLREHASAGQRWLALHLGSGSTRKSWGAEPLSAVAEALAGRGLRPLLLAGPAEAELVDAVGERLRPFEPIVARDWPLPRLAALLALCSGYVGADSGITHLAAAVGTSVVAVFGPTDPARWAPRGPRISIVRRPVPCQPCTWEAMWACPHRACLAELAPDAVIAAALRCFGLAGQSESTDRRSVLSA